MSHHSYISTHVSAFFKHWHLELFVDNANLGNEILDVTNTKRDLSIEAWVNNEPIFFSVKGIQTSLRRSNKMKSM